MRRLFEHMIAAQQVAFDALRPGATAADVDSAVLSYFAADDLIPYWKQHTGHAIGLRDHEAPFFDVGDHTRIEPGMVLTVEPASIRASSAAFAIPDTVVVTQDGTDILTLNPSDLESLIIPN
jgi:Xaa-Pro aminopeptidase